MKRTGLLVLAVALSLGGQGAHAGCDLWFKVTDKDPAGLNVRATPGGAIIGTLKGGEREVHVTGQSGTWASIDEAVLVRGGEPDEAHPLFSGAGYVAFSLLGIGRLVPYQDVFAEPKPFARVVLKLSRIKGAMPKPEVIGCLDEYVEVRVNGMVAWAHNCNDHRAASCD